VRSTSTRFCTAGSGHCPATPVRFTWSASGFPIAGRLVLPVGRLHVGQELGALTGQRSATPGHVADHPPLSGLDACLREPPATPQNVEVQGVERVVWGRAAVESVHRPRVPEDQGPLRMGPEVGEPVPGKEAFDRDYQIRPIGRNDREPGLRPGFHGVMPQDLAVLAEDTPVHAAHMPSQAGRRVGRWGGASPAVASAFGIVPVSHVQPRTAVGSGGDLQTYHGCAVDCLQRAPRFRFQPRA
jgi:hypothetical protein